MLDHWTVECFQKLYFELKVGQHLLPLGKCVMLAGFYNYSLPSEINCSVFTKLYHREYDPLNHKHQIRDRIAMLSEFRENNPSLFKYYFKLFSVALKDEYNEINSFRPMPLYEIIACLNTIELDHFANFVEPDSYLYCLPRIAILVIKRVTSKYNGIRTFGLQIYISIIAKRNLYNRDVVLQAMKACGECFLEVSSIYKDDEEVVLAAINNTTTAILEHVSDRLKNNTEIVTAAVQAWGESIMYANHRFLDDATIMSIVLQHSCGYYRHCSDRLKLDTAFTTAAIKSDPRVLSQCSHNYQDDEELVKSVVATDGLLLQYASERLKDNFNIVMAAIQQDADSFFMASRRLRNDERIIMTALRKNGYVVSDLELVHRDKKHIMTLAVMHSGHHLQMASARLQDDEEIVRIAFQTHIDSLVYASVRLRNDKAFIQSLVTEDSSELILRYVGQELQDDEDFVINTMLL